MSSLTRKSTVGNVVFVALLCLAMSVLLGLGTTARAFAATDSEYNGMRDDLLSQTDLKGNPTNHGTLSVTSTDAVDDVITIQAGETATVTLSPYQHVQWHGCRLWSKPCPTVCGQFTDECFVAMYGCMCDQAPSLETLDLYVTNGDPEVVSISDVAKSATLTETEDNLGKTNDGTLTLTGLRAGTTTVKVAVDGLYFWWPCTKTYTVKVVNDAQSIAIDEAGTHANVAVGSQATLKVATTGDVASYQWQHSTDGVKWSSTKWSSTDTLSFNMKSSLDQRQWRCIVTFDDGATLTSDTFTTTVMVPAGTITSQPQDASVAIGATAQFSVTASGDVTSYQWQHSKNGTTWNNSKWSSTGDLSFKMTASLDGRQWRCIVTFADGHSETSDVATSTVPTTVPVTIAPATLTVGSPVTLTVQAPAGTEIATYQWQHSKNGTTWNKTTWSGYNTATLTFKMTSSLDQRQWRCVMTTTSGQTITSDVATLALS